jgi:predicted nucleotidyltransferase component of viral defense system
LNGSPSRNDCADAAAELGLPHPGLVEKDFHVVRALAALRGVALDQHSLVFGGGTSLSRAHRLIHRMSEDIDLRISPTGLGQGDRKRFREMVTRSLLSCGFAFDPQTDLDVHDGGRMFRYRLRYDRQCDGVESLRPEIKVEVSSWVLLEASVPCPITSFWAEANRREPEIDSFPCVSVAETCADKFVALTRRIAQERANADERDGTLLRHAYDLLHIRPRVDLDELRPLVARIMESLQFHQKLRGDLEPAQNVRA